MTGRDYKQKMDKHLSDHNYKISTTCPTTTVERKATRMKKKSGIADKVVKTLIPGNTVSARLYR
jgi:hypothetical protein